MEWLVVSVFLIFIIGLGVVTRDAIVHAQRSSPNKPIKPTR
jgi:hypothetical protein